MKKLVEEIKNLKSGDIGKQVGERLKVFKSFQKKSNEDWFSELCFCILTSNSKMLTAKAIQDELGAEGFINLSEEEIRDCIRRNKHRFHNNKAKYIVLARDHIDIKDKLSLLKTETEKRDWLVKNIKGLGYKEGSHFLRNIGFQNLAIVDRHVQNILVEHKILKEKPKTVSPKIYLEVEKKLELLCEKTNMSQAELDMYLFYIKTEKVYK